MPQYGDFCAPPAKIYRSMVARILTAHTVVLRVTGIATLFYFFHLLAWKFPRTSIEVDLVPSKFPWKLVEVDLLLSRLVEASKEVRGIIPCQWKWKFLLLPSVAASTNILRGSLHALPYTLTYFHILPRISQTSSCFNKTCTRVGRLPFQLLPWGFPSTSMEANLYSWKLPWKSLDNIYFHGNFHESWWKYIYFHCD